MNMYKIILAEDHVLVREGIKKIIEAFPGFHVVGEVGDGPELLKLLEKLPVDMVILDISMPSLPGIEATREIKQAYPTVKVLILTMHKKKEYLHNAIAAGVDGYLLKEDAPKELLNAIDKIRQGRPTCPLLSNDLVNLYVQGRATRPNRPILSPREIEIIK
jgi:DNA-binding NarL/FixJ family response regulator